MRGGICNCVGTKVLSPSKEGEAKKSLASLDDGNDDDPAMKNDSRGPYTRIGKDTEDVGRRLTGGPFSELLGNNCLI